MLDYLHLLTLCSWLPLAILAGARTGHRSARVLWTLSVVTCLLFGYMLYLDFVWSKTVVAPIRVDLLLVIPLTTVTFTAIGVWGLRKPGAAAKIASLLLLAFSVPTLVVFAQGMARSIRETARMDTRPALVFAAQFRNARTFQNFFGTLDTRADPRAGHFRAEDPKGVGTRVIINDRGHFWLLFGCHPNVECVYADADLGATALPAAFKARALAGPPTDVVISAWNPDRLTLSFLPRQSQTFARAPVAYNESVTPPQTVTFHGAFSEAPIDRDYRHLVQLWLWQSGDRWLAYYTRVILKCGTTDDFVFASAFHGKPLRGVIGFTNARDESSLERFEIRPPAQADDHVDGEVFFSGHPLQPIALAKGAVLRSPIYESAPLVSFEATTEWLKTVSMGYNLPWTADCTTTQSGPR